VKRASKGGFAIVLMVSEKWLQASIFLERIKAQPEDQELLLPPGRSEVAATVSRGK